MTGARTWLRVEGLAIAIGAVLLLWVTGLPVPIWAAVLIVLAPDLTMLGYLAGPDIGRITYNLGHTYAAPVLLAVVGGPAVYWLAILWVLHIAGDRAVGYGLKTGSFKETHLGPVGKP